MRLLYIVLQINLFHAEPAELADFALRRLHIQITLLLESADFVAGYATTAGAVATLPPAWQRCETGALLRIKLLQLW